MTRVKKGTYLLVYEKAFEERFRRSSVSSSRDGGRPFYRKLNVLVETQTLFFSGKDGNSSS
jgi:hypothetical protein